ncbi:hypothetical protein FA15DRAFT_663811 [Coprinopsis marcescibilis]|uniref:F-box domain-containing protein n=1 Tax=Coprinopsis marcescibilis TaxID=230819 RepID=A0A5C3LCH3_COPMA|nr:hypothetical protein FA15DRAFT_663811 [Coprinopsis marcescibilis]
MQPKTADEDSKRQRIDARITALEEEICALKTQRNELSPICQLPPEVLSRIFIHFELQTSLRFHCPANRSWYQITHICRYWRSVALHCPQLWSNICVVSTFWTELFLSRSKQAPLLLEIGFQVPFAMEPRIHEILVTQMSRLSSLLVSGTTDMLKMRLHHLPSSAPSLHTLSIENSGFNETMTLPELFVEGTPQLKELRLYRCYIDWSSPLLQGLSKLNISVNDDVFYPSTHPPPPSPDVFLQALRNMTTLTHLTLQMDFPDINSKPLSNSSIALHHLEELDLAGSITGVVGFLSHITLPASAHIRLVCSTTLEDTHMASELGKVLIPSWLSVSLENPPLTLPSMRYLIVQSNYKFCHLLAGFDDTDVQFPHMGQLPPLSVTLIASESPRHTPSPSSLFRSLPLSNLHIVNLGTVLERSDIEYFSSLPGLKTVLLTGVSPTVQFLDYLRQDSAFSNLDSPGEHCTCFPNLESLSIDSYDLMDHLAFSLDDFLQLLILRVEFNRPIHQLKLVEWANLVPGDVDRIKGIVTDVVWDHHVELNRTGQSDSEFSESSLFY